MNDIYIWSEKTALGIICAFGIALVLFCCEIFLKNASEFAQRLGEIGYALISFVVYLIMISMPFEGIIIGTQNYEIEGQTYTEDVYLNGMFLVLIVYIIYAFCVLMYYVSVKKEATPSSNP